MRHLPVFPLLLLSMSGAATAMNLESSGLGQVLISPYYTVNADHQTQVSIGNRTDRGKALKVRFLEGMNGRPVFSFNLYLAPHDLWTAALFSQSSEGPATLVTLDDSCTVPALKTSISLPQLANGRRIAPFSNAQYIDAMDDVGPDDLARSREGYFEIIEMGEVINAAENSLADISPDSSGIPGNCLRIANAWSSGGYWAMNPETDLLPPGGGISAAVSLVDVLGGSMYAFSAEAIDHFSSIVQHSPPTSALPNLSSGVTSQSEGYVEAIVDRRGELAVARYPLARAIDAVSALFMASRIESEFNTAASLGADSDWLVGLPTRKFYVDGVGATAIPPFNKTFAQSWEAAPPMTTDPRGEAMQWTLHNREGSTVVDICLVNPEDCLDFGGVPHSPIVRTPSLYWSANVITFNTQALSPEGSAAADHLFGSALSQNVNTIDFGIVEGWMSLQFYADEGDPALGAHLLRADASGRRLAGLPAIGLWAFKVTNLNVLPGVLGNYASIRRHRTTTDLRIGQ